jgi:hypothetical protein
MLPPRALVAAPPCRPSRPAQKTSAEPKPCRRTRAQRGPRVTDLYSAGSRVGGPHRAGPAEPEPMSTDPHAAEPRAAAGKSRGRPKPHGGACPARTANARPASSPGSAIALRAWPVEPQRRPTRRLGRQRAIPASRSPTSVSVLARPGKRPLEQHPPNPQGRSLSGQSLSGHSVSSEQRPSAFSRGPPAAGKACRRPRRQTDCRQRPPAASPASASRGRRHGQKSTNLSNRYINNAKHPKVTT